MQDYEQHVVLYVNFMLYVYMFHESISITIKL